MDDMRNRYRLPRKDFGQETPHRPRPLPSNAAPAPADPVHDSLKHAYRPPPAPRHQPARPAPSQPWTPEPRTHRSTPARKKRRVFKKLLVTVLIFGVLGGAGAWAYPKYAHKNPFPPDIRSNAKIGLFYPAKLPPGYTISSGSIHLDNGVLTYNANNGAKRVVFTTQQTPNSFDFQAFAKQNLKNVQSLSNAYGQAVIGQNQDRALGSLVSGQSWFILSTNSPQISQDNLRLIMNSLKKY